MKNMRIGVRLGTGFALVLLLMALMTGLGIWRLKTMAAATEQMLNVPITSERLISDWSKNIFSGVRRTMAIAKSADPSLVEFFAAEAAESAKQAAELRERIAPLMQTPEEIALWGQLMEKQKAYLSSRDAIMAAKDRGLENEGNKILEQKFLPASKAYLELVQKLVDLQRKEVTMTAQEIKETDQNGRLQLMVLGAFALLLGGGCAWWLTTGITRPLRRAVEIARTVTSGDLTSRIEADAKDETGDLLLALKEMNDALVNIVGRVRAGTDMIATASNEISSGNLDLSSRTEQQASSLEETASSMEELTSTVKQNADNARQANTLAASASEVAVKGGTVVSQVVDTMGSINQSSKKIVDIISVIDGIAFQTNILALNAAVEAARAGEQGRGFAVVAAEVRTLAQRSAAAAKEIKSLIDDSVEKVDVGAKLVDQAGATMTEIVESVKRVTDIMGEIAAASQEQTAGIEQINQAISQMDEVTQQNASLVEQAAAASASLQDEAGRLAQAVSVFRLDASHAVTTAAPARKIEPALTAKAKPRQQLPAQAKAAPRIAAGSGEEWEQF